MLFYGDDILKRIRKPVLLSTLFMGLGQLVQKQYVKAALYALIEIVFLLHIPTFIHKIKGLVTLGDAKPELPIGQRDNSLFFMIEGIVFVILLVIFIVLYISNIRDARHNEQQKEKTGAYTSMSQFWSTFADKSFTLLGLSPVIVLLVFFVLVPILFSALIAFTNYASPEHIPPAKTVDWTGTQAFQDLATLSTWKSAFVRTASWTLLWAVLSTLTCYAGGTLAALALSDKKIKLPGFFRAVYVLPYAVPALLSLLMWRILLNGQFGPINRMLMEWGWLQKGIPWLSEPNLARFSVILVNLWLGFPYFMLLITGTMTSIPADVYEAAAIDGANKRTQFFKITLPLLLYQTIPLIIMTFSYNLNNFGAVFFLTGGGPMDTLTTQSGAGATDILMSWMYKLTLDLRQYNKAAVLSILIFAVIAPFAIYNFSRTKAFKDGEL